MAKTYDIRPGRAKLWDPVRFNTARIAAGYTWQALADRLGISKDTLYTYRGRTRPPRELVPRIARALRVRVEVLFGERVR